MRRSTYQNPGLNPVWAIIGLNFMVLIFTMINQRAAYSLLGLTPAYVSKQPWTLVTSLFIHGGFWHFFSNMLAFYFFGSYLQSLIGEKKLLMVYFGGGLLGSITFLLLASEFSTVVGASGAVFSVCGALAFLNPRLRVLVFFFLPLPLWAVIILGLVLISPGIAWQAHLGGLIFGLVAGYFFRRKLRQRYWW
ncbi:MAG: rhomboid family intramembrane serine protease [Dehalococcoidales bacterium]|jgi:membrane associated rhomboid family serine protease